MLWDSALISRLLELYRANRVLWDQRHPNYSNKMIKQMALQGIQEELGIPLPPADIHRKYRTMRAAYQVEVRNINAAKIRGFFYKPTLHWFEIFHRFMEDTKEMKIEDRNEMAVREDTKKYVYIKNKGSRRRPKDIPLLEERDSSDMEEDSDDSGDEFQTFANHIAEQLRNMSVHRAVMIQNQIQRIFARDREIMDEEEYIIE